MGDTLQVELIGLERTSRRAYVGPTGDFEFESLPVGDYQLRVLDFHGNVLRQDFVSVDDDFSYLSVRLPQQPVQQPVSGTVSVGELQQKVPSKALREFRKASQELAKRATLKSIDHSLKAIALYPSYVDAHNLLGVCYSSLNQLDSAAAAFRHAAELAPDSPEQKSNLSVALLFLQDYKEAEKAARQALKLNPNQPAAHFVLGFSLHAQQRDGNETLESLQRAAIQLPRARLAAAAILCQDGRKSEAASELQEYLHSPDDTADLRAVESWLAALHVQASPQPLADARETKADPNSRP